MEEFKVGDVVEKYTGDYQLKGIVVAKFFTTANKERYVVEHVPGFLHIYSANNIRKVQMKINKVIIEEEIVTITKKEYEDLLDSQKWLDALEGAGVDNWSGYGYAAELYRNEEDE